MYKSYHKKVDRSMLEWGITLPLDLIKDFEAGYPLKKGTSRNVEIQWGKKKYNASIRHDNRKSGATVYQIRWDNNRELLKKLRKTFIQSYLITMSQLAEHKKSQLAEHKKDKNSKQYRTRLKGGQQEVLQIKPVDKNLIKIDVFISIKSEFDELFQKFVEDNVFLWLYNKDKKYLIYRSTEWMNVKEFVNHHDNTNVIYYLANTSKKLIYIGMTRQPLGKRIKVGKKHQDMPPGWDMFRYDIVLPEYVEILGRIEDHTIRSFASFLKNQIGYPSLEISNFKLMNRTCKKL